jgi:hypothetical protein
MKTLLKIAVGILVCLVLALLVLRVTGLAPRGLRPGLWLKGNLVTTPVTDWSFAEKAPFITIQMRTWYLLPHSVNVSCLYHNGHLYISSVQYRQGVKYRWNEYLIRDPHVRIKIGNQLYDRTATLVTHPAEKEGVLGEKVRRSINANPTNPELTPSMLSSPNVKTNVFRISDN